MQCERNRLQTLSGDAPSQVTYQKQTAHVKIVRVLCLAPHILERKNLIPIVLHAHDHPPAIFGLFQAAIEATGRGAAVIGELALGVVVLQQHGEACALAAQGHRRRTDYVRQA